MDALPHGKLITMVALIGWLALFVWRIARRLPTAGAAVAVLFVLSVVSLAWSGAAPAFALATLVALCVVTITGLLPGAPVKLRSQLLLLIAGGGGAIVFSWLQYGLVHWRVVLVALVGLGAIGLGLAYLLGYKFAESNDVRRLELPTYPLYKYTYWSQRAVADVLSDNSGTGRFHLKVKELKLPSLGGVLPEVLLDRPTDGQGRHAKARAFENSYAQHLADSPNRIINSKGGLLRGSSAVFGTFYGTEGIDDTLTSGRIALFATAGTDKRVAVCLFGSKENLEGWIQDSHPERVGDWSFSTGHDVMRWLQESAPWNEERWNESIGTVACKMANYWTAYGLQSHFGVRSELRTSLFMRQDDAEWLGFIYHVETGVTDMPFDTILVGRPLWLRSTHLDLMTTDENDDLAPTEESAYSRLWKQRLRIAESSSGWPLQLYRLIMRLRGLATTI